MNLSNSRAYKSWHAMRGRCLNPSDKGYKRYGGRGITICRRWLDFKFFKKDMGERPKDKTLERINNNLGYFPKNCKWANASEQNNNKRTNIFINFDGKRMTVAQWSRYLGIEPSALGRRFKRWPIRKSITFPILTNRAIRSAYISYQRGSIMGEKGFNLLKKHGVLYDGYVRKIITHKIGMNNSLSLCGQRPTKQTVNWEKVTCERCNKSKEPK